MPTDSEIQDTIQEWSDWRNLDHRLINDGKPSKLDAAVNLYVMEQHIDTLIRDIKLASMSNKNVSDDYVKLKELIKEYQERIYITVLGK